MQGQMHKNKHECIYITSKNAKREGKLSCQVLTLDELDHDKPFFMP
jgi:hypothetical protein